MCFIFKQKQTHLRLMRLNGGEIYYLSQYSNYNLDLNTWFIFSLQANITNHRLALSWGENEVVLTRWFLVKNMSRKYSQDSPLEQLFTSQKIDSITCMIQR